MCVCVTVQFSLYQVHPGTDLVVKRLNVFQQVQLTLDHRRWTRFGCVCLSVCGFLGVCALFHFYAGVCVCACLHHSVFTIICCGIRHLVVVIFRLYFLKKHTNRFSVLVETKALFTLLVQSGIMAALPPHCSK